MISVIKDLEGKGMCSLYIPLNFGKDRLKITYSNRYQDWGLWIESIVRIFFLHSNRYWTVQKAVINHCKVKLLRL